MVVVTDMLDVTSVFWPIVHLVATAPVDQVQETPEFAVFERCALSDARPVLEVAAVNAEASASSVRTDGTDGTDGAYGVRLTTLSNGARAYVFPHLNGLFHGVAALLPASDTRAGELQRCIAHMASYVEADELLDRVGVESLVLDHA
jgi:hypothetical protein